MFFYTIRWIYLIINKSKKVWFYNTIRVEGGGALWPMPEYFRQYNNNYLNFLFVPILTGRGIRVREQSSGLNERNVLKTGHTCIKLHSSILTYIFLLFYTTTFEIPIWFRFIRDILYSQYVRRSLFELIKYHQ